MTMLTEKSDTHPQDGPTTRSSEASSQFRVLASGYYGFDNLGDELILRVLAQELHARGIHLTVLSANPQKTVDLFGQYGVEAIKRNDLKAITKALETTHLFISGGGGLFQDATGMGSPIYYGGLIQLAAFMEVPVFFWSQGIGPLNRPLSRWLTGKALKKCRMITVRDKDSAQWTNKLLKSSQNQAEVTADPVWLLKLPQSSPHPELDGNGFNIGVSLRPWGSLNGERIESFAKYLLNVPSPEPNQEKRILLYEFQPNTDRKPLEQLADALKLRNFNQIHWFEASDVLGSIGYCHRFYGMRFHSLILSILAGVPAMGLIYDPKVMALVESLKLQGVGVGNLEEITSHVNESEFIPVPREQLDYLRRQSAVNIEKIVSLLETNYGSEKT